jgi:hypothetical protein
MALHKEQKLWVWGTQPPLMATFYRNYHMLDSAWNVRHFGIHASPHPHHAIDLLSSSLSFFG